MTRFARRTEARGGDELATILAGSPPGVLSMTGGFPNPATFPGDVLEDIAARILREDAAVALQYAPVAGLASVREYLRDRLEATQGRRPADGELMVTSGGMECITLAGLSLLDPGDTVLVEAPTYLGALMAFGGLEARIEGIATDEDGLIVDALEERLRHGPAPKLLYIIPDFQNPTGRTLAPERRTALVEVCRRHGLPVLEDVAYRELAFDGTNLPSLWSLAPDVVVQAGTFSKTFFPGVRLGWAAGPAELVAQLVAAKQNTDQCAGALGQRLLEEYGRAGHFERRLPEARALYASHWRAIQNAFDRHLPDGCTWTKPAGGFLTWLRLPDGMDGVALRPAALDCGVAYVPGPPFYAADDGRGELRLSFSHLGEDELDEAVRRLADAIMRST